MKNEHNDITNQQNAITSFVFEQQDTTLIINAQTDRILYTCHFPPNPYVTFDSLKDSLQARNFTIVSQNHQTMKVKVAEIFDLQFFSKDKLIIDELKQSIHQLNQKLQNQIEKNHQLSQITTNQQIRIQVLQDKTTTLNESVQDLNQKLQNQIEKNHQLSQTTTSLQIKIQVLQEKTTTLNESIHELNQNLQTQIEKNNQLSQITTNQQIKIQTLQEKNVTLNDLVQNLLLTTDSLKEELAKRKKLQDEFMNETKQSKSLQETTNQKMTQKYTNLISQLAQLRTQFDQLVTQTIPKCLIEETQFMKFSRVVCSPEEKSTIRKFFTKAIRHVKLLYRASDDGFCAKKFHEKCDGVGDTLTVAWTEFDRKIGGYTPLKWSSQDGYVADNSKESFIFSLTHNDKFTMEKPENAIHNHTSWGPRFGSGCDFGISDKANLGNSSYVNICTSYHNTKYTKESKQSWQRFHGGSTGNFNFKIKEWQVWGVEWA